MSVQSNINFNGNCRQAIEFYSEVFNTKNPEYMLYEDSPNKDFPLTEDVKKLILHAIIEIKGTKIICSDVPMNYSYKRGNNVNLVVNIDNKEEMDSIYNKLKDGGTVIMEPQKTFSSNYYGFVCDKYGIGWSLNLIK
jgi:PhnB protein